MGKTRSINVELSTEVIQVLESRVASGEYPSTAAAIEAAVRLLVQEDGDADLQAWIETDIVERMADVERGDPLRPADRVFSDLQARHLKTRTKAG
ncbi:ribbon-helix-helix domain-containing protein [Rhizobium sp. SAFR-030]|uniref:ribbon-helix-helix domain-containing protein n=1 Tax=Rhizobium sp. SAFR-030 TaxID=3387277 RepID=UPI003F7EF7A9